MNALESDEYSVKTRTSIIKALRGFPDMDSFLKKEVINFLKEIINDTESQLSLRGTAVNVLGFLGEGMPEVAEYLRQIGSSENTEVSKNENLRLIALIHLGGNKADFEFSVDTLAEWLKGRNYEEKPLNIQSLEIPKAFLDLIRELEIEKTEKERAIAGEGLNNYITVLGELISSGVLDIEVKLELFKILISWSEKDSDIKDFLKEIQTNPAKDIKIYLEELSQEILSEKNSEAFSFWEEKIKGINVSEGSTNALLEIDSIIEEFNFSYPNLSKNTKTEIVERIEKVANIYKKIWNP